MFQSHGVSGIWVLFVLPSCFGNLACYTNAPLTENSDDQFLRFQTGPAQDRSRETLPWASNSNNAYETSKPVYTSETASNNTTFSLADLVIRRVEVTIRNGKHVMIHDLLEWFVVQHRSHSGSVAQKIAPLKRHRSTPGSRGGEPRSDPSLLPYAQRLSPFQSPAAAAHPAPPSTRSVKAGHVWGTHTGHQSCASLRISL